MKRLVYLLCCSVIMAALPFYAMAQPFTHADTVRGSNGPGREWWDALQYDLQVIFNIPDSTITGCNRILLRQLHAGPYLQIDLQEPLVIDSVIIESSIYAGKQQKFRPAFSRSGNAFFIDTGEWVQEQATSQLFVYYHGKPHIARRAPWDGGVIWQQDKLHNPWVSVACQGLGASVWYPCKDYQGDEPDSAAMHITIPDSLACVGNGRFGGSVQHTDGTATFSWAVVSPINNYNLIPYIGKYVHFSEVYPGAAGQLDMDYWVLDYNLDLAKKQFKDAPKMMKAFEYWFGPYPFYKDGYKLVEAPHLGMEHQSAVAYGNGYQNGYLGKDWSGSGWGKKWDYIIVHESGHEWFANNITTQDIADMWVHESFTAYSEALFTEYWYGKKAGADYVTGTRKNAMNLQPIIRPYGVNAEGDIDMYFKGANMIHTIRQIINNDSVFREILIGLNRYFYHQTVTSAQVEEYMSTAAGINLKPVFDQYLRSTQIPVLEYRVKKNKIQYRYTNCDKNFSMPLKIYFGGEKWITPGPAWKTLRFNNAASVNFTSDPNFYINTKKTE